MTSVTKLTFDPYSRACPSRGFLSRLGEKWTVLVVLKLADGPQRYSDLAKEIDGISQKMLTKTLKSLQSDGLVERKIYDDSPPRVEYGLTERGYSLLGPLQGLMDWAVTHMPEQEIS
ncbi:winged helix-turn-helix transcriptional regulator [Corynebacterium epidermidicanis]|uniref:Transcriptional regulator, HxlR family n=1 Tax=Corynebacterium epidermidicanis TaxID=1050174 RepID=A0A0G3GLG9_9CORY|nr:helix-turn-helix domain-containing protein [Corynebacterium epidermidicanis]AKK02081.1 transcriptional regulator, HxlR family [Corynebacterium epidermidicanis]